MWMGLLENDENKSFRSSSTADRRKRVSSAPTAFELIHRRPRLAWALDTSEKQTKQTESIDWQRASLTVNLRGVANAMSLTYFGLNLAAIMFESRVKLRLA